MPTTLQLTVAGMTCGGCENAARRALAQVQGVADVTASFKTGQVGVTFDATRVTPSMLKARIEELGYSVAL